MAADEPVVSVDTKKKELVGNFKNNGRELRPKGSPEAVNVHDFIDKKLGRAVPYGIYDIGDNKGWVSVGSDRFRADRSSFTRQRSHHEARVLFPVDMFGLRRHAPFTVPATLRRPLCTVEEFGKHARRFPVCFHCTVASCNCRPMILMSWCESNG